MPYGAIEAELWGVHEDVHVEDGLAIRKATGAFGTLWEIECSSLWRFWRLHAVLTLLPPGAGYRAFDGTADDDEDCDGVLLIHYWEDAKNHVIAGGTYPPTSIC